MPSPKLMRAIVHETREAAGLKLHQLPVPQPGAEEVLIRVKACGVNRPDVLQRQGLYPPPPGASHRLGLEVAGEIVAVGDSVHSLELGQTVCALVNGGGYSDYCLASAGQVLPVPKGLSMVQAAALPETFFTVWHNVFQRGQLKAGEILLVHGAGSGIGTTAIQLAVNLGARVVASAGGPEKCDAAITLGAERAIDYHTEDFVAVVRELGGADVILDMVGGDYIARNIKAAKPDGRIVNIAYLQSSKAELDFMPVMLKRLTLTGSTLRAQSAERKKQIAQQLLQNVWPLLGAKQIAPVIAASFPLERADEAHALMESNRHIGKIVLTTE
ncbi:NAD(P)H-quinone oxidoreductase [Gilvimarinus xylanilyticus]|uniref:NAD(P)H-quinone oxidoreductase n=1 Tax=Gilvimarinus xylanilyticus TaxID=2944139 RepID=A0A9X2HWD5_9GAMM|nr:NAD(P)H-quinone oxidoreductase [Gilvimarinus xylanilyticus]MCP8897796.1 NAD(P)H-quinone oxidoreductase [Gilvimarinus xylanilyticus]